MAKKAPIRANAQVYHNSDKVIRWHVLNKDESGYEDTAGWTLSFKVATTQGGTSVLTKTVVNEDSTTGLVKVDLDPADTVSLTPGTYYYTLARTNSGLEDPVADGEFVLKPRVQ